MVDFEYATASLPYDEIRYRGFGDAPRAIRVHYTTLEYALFAGETVKTYRQLFPQLPWGSTADDSFNPTVVSSLELPNGRSYALTYNSYGEVAEVTLPTGGYHQYTHGKGHPNAGPGGEYNGKIYRRLLEKRVFNENDQLQLRNSFSQEQAWGTRDQYILANHDIPAGGSFSEFHEFHGRASDQLAPEQPASYAQWKDGREYRIETLSGAGAALRTVEHVWLQLSAVPWKTDIQDTPAYEPRIRSTRTIRDDGTELLTQYDYDFEEDPGNTLDKRFTNTIDAWEFDLGDGSLKRRRHTEYFKDPVYIAPSVHLRQLPLREDVYDGGGVLAARTTYEYDVSSTPLVSRPTLSGRLDPDPFGTSYTTRGNVTAVRRWLNTTNQDLVEQRQYDMAGNVVKVIDPRLFATAYTYSDRFGPPDGIAQDNPNPLPDGKRSYAFASAVVNAKSQITYTQRDYATGQPVDVEDENGVVTSAVYNDPLDRLTKILRAFSPAHAAFRNRTQFFYDDNARIVTTVSDKDSFGDDAVKHESLFDGLGREVETRLYESATGHIRTFKAYDGLGRVITAWNPHRPGDDIQCTAGNLRDCTQTSYDALGRRTLVTLPGGGPVTTHYWGATTTVTDPAGKVRQSTADALGRMVTLLEDPSGLNYETSYGYDVLDNLTQVTQGGQIRTFGYDSLSRLTFSTTPEAGTVLYNEYDGNANLRTKTDARNVVTQYTYDGLNRILTRTYSDGTPGVTFTYDAGNPAVPYVIGRLVSVTAAGTTSRQDEYDPLGRVLRSSQTTDGVAFNQSYTYDLAGRLRSETYPSGRVVATTYDQAGRISGVQGARASLGSISYMPHGAVTSARLGNGLWETTLFNMRLQPKWIRLGQSPTTSEIFELQNGYGNPATNNGNIYAQPILALGVPFSIGYTYDGVNRLGTATENWGAAAWLWMTALADTCLAPAGCETSEAPEKPGATTWAQTYGYDRWGNRAVTAGTVLDPVLTPNSLSLFNTSTNRLTNSGYDNAGNQTLDASNRAFTYDGENRQISASGGANYVYDGLGRRVKKVQGTTTTTFVYDAFGKLVAEYCSPAGTCGTMIGVRYVTTDHLGSTRVVTDEAAQVLARHDYLPFGEETPASYGDRSLIGGYGSESGVRQKFTGKERDLETGLDYFGARYGSGAQGRFTSADPSMKVGPAVRDPQAWNRYLYVRNNPFKYVDPDGADMMLAASLSHPTRAADRQYLITHLARLSMTAKGAAYLKRADASSFKVVLDVGPLPRRSLTPPSKPGEFRLGPAKTHVTGGTTSYNTSSAKDKTYLVAAGPPGTEANEPIRVTVDPENTAATGGPVKTLAHELGGHTANVLDLAERPAVSGSDYPGFDISGLDPDLDEQQSQDAEEVGKVPKKASPEAIDLVNTILVPR